MNPNATLDQILEIAANESAALGHNFVGTEHLVCSLAQSSDLRLQALFRRCIVTIDAVRLAVRKIDGEGAHRSLEVSRPLTPRLKKLLATAAVERMRLAHLTVSQSLLLAVVSAKEESGVGARALSSLEINLDQMRVALEEPNQSPEPTRFARGSS